jgi:hypothetical protein
MIRMFSLCPLFVHVTNGERVGLLARTVGQALLYHSNGLIFFDSDREVASGAHGYLLCEIQGHSGF